MIVIKILGVIVALTLLLWVMSICVYDAKDLFGRRKPPYKAPPSDDTFIFMLIFFGLLVGGSALCFIGFITIIDFIKSIF